MAGSTISQPAPVVKNTDDIRFLSIGSMPAVLSTEVARHFQRRHSHVLRDIDRLRSILPKSFTAPNFGLSEYTDSTGRKLTAYLLTRDALSLLVMGMTGKAAIMWKLRYIEAFNAMEACLRDMAALGGAEAPSKEAIRESGYREGYDEGRGETARLFWKLGPTQKRRLRRVMRYHAMGLSQREIGRLLDIPRRSVQELLKAAEALGLPTEKPARLVQGNLLEVEA